MNTDGGIIGSSAHCPATSPPLAALASFPALVVEIGAVETGSGAHEMTEVVSHYGQTLANGCGALRFENGPSGKDVLADSCRCRAGRCVGSVPSGDSETMCADYSSGKCDPRHHTGSTPEEVAEKVACQLVPAW